MLENVKNYRQQLLKCDSLYQTLKFVGSVDHVFNSVSNLDRVFKSVISLTLNI